MWFNEKRKQERRDHSREKLMEEIKKRTEAADNLIERLDRHFVDRRHLVMEFEGPERRHA